MKSLAELTTANLIWNASVTEDAVPARMMPADIFQMTNSNEIFFDYADGLTVAPPVTAFLPYLQNMLASKKKTIGNESFSSPKKLIVFIGREIWPTPFYLQACFPDHHEFLFINPKTPRQRSRAIQTALSSPEVFALVAFCEKLLFPFTQKILLLAKQHKIFSFIFRRGKERMVKSAAQARWLVSPHATKGDCPCWRLQLLHVKGSFVSDAEWIFECNYGSDTYEEKVSLNILPKFSNRLGPEEVAAERYA